jgi:D-glycero-beta-D-manno-heptose-7-phosphate kinase
MLGRAANVVNNIASLGGKAILCGITGDDETGSKILERIKDLGFVSDGILVEHERPTTIKTRIVAHNQQVVRFDRESRSGISPESVERFLGFIREVRDGVDAVVVSDYGKGVVSREFMKRLRDLLSDLDIVLAVDPKTGKFESYYGVDVITPNHHEAGAFCSIEIVDEQTLLQAGRQLLKDLCCRSVLITQGKNGMTLFENGGAISHIPTVAQKVFDVTGAGDTVISTFSLGLASGLDLRSAAIISNFAAGIVVGEVGTSTVRADELKRVILKSQAR